MPKPMPKSDLFDLQRQQLVEKEAPLAARMRPRTLDEYIGQEHIIGPGRLLRRAIQADQLSSVIFYGPPGTGKTTLARVIANTTRAHFIAINAVLAGVKDIRDATEVAQQQRGMYGRRTILFVDEVHRFNKAQQDALLPWVENGTVILIGATTENPYFSVNRPLVSRSRIFQLKPLTEDALAAIARQALADPERGYGSLNVVIDDDALAHLVNVANGDARAVLNALELAVETTPPTPSQPPPAKGRSQKPPPSLPLRGGGVQKFPPNFLPDLPYNRMALTNSLPLRGGGPGGVLSSTSPSPSPKNRSSAARCCTTKRATITSTPSAPTSSRCAAPTPMRRCIGWPRWSMPARTRALSSGAC